MPGVTHGADQRSAAASSGAVNQGEMYVRLAPHEERVFSWARLVKGLVTLDPLAAFRGNYSQGAGDAAGSRARLRKFRDLRAQVRNIQSFNFGGGRADLDLAMRGPELDGAGRVHRKAATEGARARHRRRRHRRCKLNKPELQVQIDRARAADSGVDTRGHRLGAARDGRRRRRGDALPRLERQRRLRRPAAPDRSATATTRRRSRGCYVPRSTASWCGSTTW